MSHLIVWVFIFELVEEILEKMEKEFYIWLSYKQMVTCSKITSFKQKSMKLV